jgi:hypothetical protein
MKKVRKSEEIATSPRIGEARGEKWRLSKTLLRGKRFKKELLLRRNNLILRSHLRDTVTPINSHRAHKTGTPKCKTGLGIEPAASECEKIAKCKFVHP